VIEAESEPDAARAAASAFDEIARIEQALSDYRTDSESMRLMRQAPGEWHTVSETLFEVLVQSMDIHNRTNGAFDPTIGAISHLWRGSSMPSGDELTRALDRVGFSKLHFDQGTRSVMFDRNGMILDFGGIGKGYAAQRAIDLLRSQGFMIASVDMGGDLALGDPPSDHSEGWRVEIITGLGTNRSVSLANCAITTSGDLERFYEYEGVRYSHIIDPRTGYGIRERRAVTVIAPDASIADAIASAVSVLGEDGLEHVRAAYPDVSIELVTRSMEDQ
jgi:thiamine biosynthesis lipoprotein